MSADPVERLRGVVQGIVVQTLDAEMKAVTGTDDPYPDSRAVTSRILTAIVEELRVLEVFRDSRSEVRGPLALDALSTLLRATRAEDKT